MADLTVEVLTRILQRIGASASEVDELVAAIDETKVYATEVALLAASPADGTLAYAENTDNFWFRRNGAWTTQGSAGEVLSVVSKTAAYTATGNDHTILVDATSGAVTITLPAAASHSGREYVVKKTDSSANAVTIDGNASETIDGATTYVLSEQYEVITIQCNGSNWLATAREKRVPVAAKTSAYTATANDGTLLVDATSGAVTITLPAAASHASRTYSVKKTDSSANAVTVDGNGAETIDGAATQVLSEQYETLIFQSDGSAWHALSREKRIPIATKTGAYTATANDGTLLVDATGGAVTITLPAAASHSGRQYTIKKIDSSANAVTVDGNAAETIDGAATVLLTEQHENILIQSNGTAWYTLSQGRREPVVAKTEAYTATANDRTILCDATGGAFSVTLPAAADNTGRIYNIKKTDAGGNDVTIDGNASETIDGATTLALNAQYDVAIIQCDGTGWHVLSKIITP